MAKKPSWTKIRNEYIAGGISQKDLAKKYGIPLGTLRTRAAKERWRSIRDENHTKVIQKTIEKISNKQSDDAARIDSIADKILLKLEKAADELDRQVLSFREEVPTEDGKRITEYAGLGDGSGPIDSKAVRQLTAALAELKQIKGLQTDLQRMEQEARIAVLRKNAADEEKGSIEITLGEGLATLGK